MPFDPQSSRAAPRGPRRLRGMPLAAVLGAALCTNLPAKDVDGRFAAFGPGARPCTAYAAMRGGSDPLDRDWIAWLTGYLSAFNVIVPGTFNIVGDYSVEEVLAWLDQYCAAHPDERFANAAAALTVALYPERNNLSPKTRGRSWDKWGTSGDASAPP